MAEKRRTSAVTLGDPFVADARRFSFFQAVELIERQRPKAPRVGYRGPSDQEPIRFVGNPSLGFPSSDIDSIERIEGEGDAVRYRMVVNFLGLYGQSSPLPAWYTEELVHDELDDHAVKDFLDLFQHRAVSLLQRCWAKYRYYREYRPDGTDPISLWLFALMGVLHPQLRQATSLNWQRLIACSGILSMRNQSASALQGVLTHYFPQVKVEIRQFVRRMVAIPPSQLALLGSANSRLSDDITIGARVPDCSSTIRVVLGPMGLDRFCGFLPSGRDHLAARELVSILLIDQLRCEIEIIIRADEIPPLRLAAGCMCQLGWSTWLGERECDGVVVFP